MSIRFMRRYSAVIALLVLSAVSFVSAGEDVFIAAKVGSVPIPETMVQEALAQYVPSGGFHLKVNPEQREKYRTEALSQLIDVELFYQGALKRALTVPADVTEKIIDDNIKRFGSREKLAISLEKKQMTLQQLRERIEKIQMVKLLLQSLSSESVPSDTDIAGYYEKNRKRFMRPESVRLLHIMVKADNLATEEEWLKKREYTEGILKDIKGGKDFGAVAYDMSEDAYRYKSGDVGFIHRGQFEFRDLEDAAFQLKEGEMSGVLRSIYGFHILKAMEKKPAQTLTLEEAKETIRRELRQKNFDAKKGALIDQLKKEYPVTIYDKAATPVSTPAAVPAK